jgi:hypothetical protein
MTTATQPNQGSDHQRDSRSNTGRQLANVRRHERRQTPAAPDLASDPAWAG